MVAAAACCVAIVGGSLAYFQDSDADKNVMVSGNVKIVQNETDRNGKPFVDGQKLMPAVYNGELSYDGEDYLGGKIWDKSVDNEIDKIITVTNEGSEPAFIRTIVLFENTADNRLDEKIHALWNNSDGQYRVWPTDANGAEVQVTIGDVLYSVAVCQYESPLAAGATSAPSLKQVFVDPSATQDWLTLLGEDKKFNILALSQAVQVQGFEDEGAAVALDTAFGKVTGENVVAWFAAEGIA